MSARTTVAALGMAACTAVGGVLIAAAPADAAVAPNRGDITYAWQDASTHEIHVRGYAYNGRSRSSAKVRILVDGRWLHTSDARNASPSYDKKHHLKGKHGFRSVFKAPARAHKLTLASGTGTITSRGISRYATTGSYVIDVARRHVGARYRYGADGPKSFDCSGYAKYVFGRTDLANLPHNSESQRHAKGVHRISRKSARPGDLIFYLSGGKAYHVAIYAGHGKQYSATNPSRGVEYSKVSSSHVVYGTTWHR